MPNRDIIAIGGSAGSGPVLRQIAAALPEDFAGSIFIATHVPTQSTGHLAAVLADAGPLPASQAIDGQPIERGRIYVAAPDRHLLLGDGAIRLGQGPRENMARPAIDPLFRSAALAYGSRAVGVVLSGLLNDGAAGLHAITSVGGTAIVQHPLDAAADQMPLAALEATEVDYVAAAADLAGVLTEVATSEAGPGKAPSEGLALEVEIAAGERVGSQNLRRLADPSPLTCPDCHGVLSEMRDGEPLRYRCQIGHAYTAETLVANIDEVDQAVRVAMRVMEERVALVERMAQDARDTGRTAVAELYESRALEYRGYAKTLREAAILSLRMATRADDRENDEAKALSGRRAHL
ncbi:MAG TPA: chemotaxis protein CheB [Sphingomonas sp.]|nr:chemotaxis protein CheB [Sphingomonas sp.]